MAQWPIAPIFSVGLPEISKILHVVAKFILISMVKGPFFNHL